MSIYEEIPALLKTLPWWEDQTVYLDGLPDEPHEAGCIYIYGGAYQRLHGPKQGWTEYGIEVRTRSYSPKEARNRATSARDILDGVTNRTIGGALYQKIFAINPPTLIEREVGGEVTYSVSFNVVRRTSDD